jgi:hypothetical protein
MTDTQNSPRSEVSEELRTLGQRLREAFTTIRDGQQAQEFQQELKRGLGDLRHEIQEIIESEEVQRLGESMREAIEDVSQGDIGQQVRRGVLAALKELNMRIESVIVEAEKPTESTQPEQPSS